MKLEGSLDAFSLPDIFALLSMTKKSGGLHLRRGGSHGAVWLADGLLTGGSSDLTRESLGRRVASSGQVSDAAIANAVRVAAGGEVGVTRVLRDAAAVDEGDLHTLVCEQIIDTVFDLMCWTDGDFAFVVDEPNPNDIGAIREVDETVTEARRRLEIWATIDPRLADPSTVVSIALNPGGDPTLSREEWSLVAMIDGRRTVGELVAISGRGGYRAVVALAELASRGLLLVGDSGGVDALTRRQDLLAALETASPAPVTGAEPSYDEPPAMPVLEVPSAPQPVAPGPVFGGDVPVTEIVAMAPSHSARFDDEEDDEDDGPIAAVSTLPRSADVGGSLISPNRPEPFMPPRVPDHPEPLAAAAVGGGVVPGAAPAANPAAAIERDPSVNKSLLLRLIAGVRGL